MSPVHGVRVSVGDGHARQRRHASRHAAPQPTARPSSFHEQLVVLFRFHILCRFVVVKNANLHAVRKWLKHKHFENVTHRPSSLCTSNDCPQ
jgi:hypothetical protein